MILVIDNYDSFTYNLVQYLGELGGDVVARRNDERICLELISRVGRRVLILGVCLGPQAIGQVFGGRVVRASTVVHGKASEIKHDGRSIFKGLNSPFKAGRYHSLVVERESLPDCLEVSAETNDGVIMGLRHREKQIEGVQFHPESILTSEGKRLLQNFLEP